MSDHDGHTINVGPVTVGIDTDRIRNLMLCNADVPCGKLTMGHVWHDIRAMELVDEVDRLRAALEEEFDFDHLPIPRFVNYLIDIWYEGDGYDPGDEYEVTDAVLRSIRRATKAEAAAAKVQEAEG